MNTRALGSSLRAGAGSGTTQSPPARRGLLWGSRFVSSVPATLARPKWPGPQSLSRRRPGGIGRRRGAAKGTMSRVHAAGPPPGGGASVCGQSAPSHCLGPHDPRHLAPLPLCRHGGPAYSRPATHDGPIVAPSSWSRGSHAAVCGAEPARSTAACFSLRCVAATDSKHCRARMRQTARPHGAIAAAPKLLGSMLRARQNG